MTGPSYTLDEQIEGARFARERLSADLERGYAAASAKEQGELRAAIGRLSGVLATLNWLSRDRDGCVRLLTTRLAADPSHQQEEENGDEQGS